MSQTGLISTDTGFSFPSTFLDGTGGHQSLFNLLGDLNTHAQLNLVTRRCV